MRHPLPTVVCLLAACVFSFSARAVEDPAMDMHDLVVSGQHLTEQEAAACEERIKANPADLKTRTQLLGHYFPKQFSPDAAAKREVHILWIIEHHPEAEIAGSPYALPMDDATEGFKKAKQAWMAQLDKHPDSLPIIAHAAGFFRCGQDHAMTAKLLLDLEKKDPENAKWPMNLAHLDGLRAADARDAAKRRAFLASALQYTEKAMALAKDDETKFDLMTDLPMRCFGLGLDDKARTHAAALLTAADTHKDDWNHGNALHKANLVLGLLALKAGEVDKAKDYLLAAGQTPGSPQLNSFGPNMTLAKALLEKGERKAVIAYLRLCTTFWEMGGDRLKAWEKEINDGKVPDFGANLLY